MSDPGSAWADFCRRLGALAGALPDEERAEGARHLARQAVMALQGHLEHGDPAHPSLHRYEEPWVQWGGPNPDNVYVRAAIARLADPTAAQATAVLARESSGSSSVTRAAISRQLSAANANWAAAIEKAAITNDQRVTRREFAAVCVAILAMPR